MIMPEVCHSNLCCLYFQEEVYLYFVCSKTDSYGQVSTPPQVFLKGYNLNYDSVF